MLNEIRIGGKRIRTGDYLSGKWKAVRKLPVIVGAIQIPEDFEVDTLEGTHSAKAGDYLIKGVRGELYLIKGDIFDETYEYLKITTLEDCQACKRFDDVNTICFDYPEMSFEDARKHVPSMIEMLFMEFKHA